uniref:Uncharacterized protein n=1 Tax=Salix viminalis TaxID=40686 RepID=A0A6N2LPF5_SALVM
MVYVSEVKSEHLSELRAKSSAMSLSDDPRSGSFKPFDLLGNEGGSGGWTGGAGTSTEGDGWNAGGLSTERASWSRSGFTLQPETNTVNPSNSVDNEPNKGSS